MSAWGTASTVTLTFLISGYMFNGSIAALVTPFTDQGEIDTAAVCRLVDFHLEKGTDGLVVAGTTGEASALSREEFQFLLKQVVGRVAGRVPVIAGTGCSSTAQTTAYTAEAAEQGADAALVVTPYYVRPPQRGLAAHFLAVADAVDVPILLYNVPSRTGVDLLPETVGKLSDHPRIAGIKEAVADKQRFQQLLAYAGPGFSVLSGDDASCLQSMRQGAGGVVSVAANVVPGLMHTLCEASEMGDWDRAEALNSKLMPLFDVLMIETNPIPVKWSLFAMGLAGPGLRLPLLGLEESRQSRVRQVLRDLDLVRT